MLDVALARAHTPGVDNVTHFNNAGSSLPPEIVVDTTIDHLRREAEIGGYEASEEAADRVHDVYRSIATLIGAQPEQIACVENATRAWDMAVYGYPFRAGDRVLTARAEYASNAIALLQLQRRHGIEIVLIEDDESGQISLEHLRRELDRGAVMMSLTHIPTNGGLVNPARSVGEICSEYGVFYVLDACQSIGHVPIDVGQLRCDVLSATGRKYLRGPRGTGFLYASDRALDILEPPFLDLHAATWTSETTYEIRSDAKKFENWETNYATKLGLGAAVEYALAAGPDETWSRIQSIACTLRERLDGLGNVTVHDKGQTKGGIVTFSVQDVPAATTQQSLRRAGINTSVSPPEYAHFDLPHRGLPALVRASLHYFNTDAEIDQLIQALET